MRPTNVPRRVAAVLFLSSIALRVYDWDHGSRRGLVWSNYSWTGFVLRVGRRSH